MAEILGLGITHQVPIAASKAYLVSLGQRLKEPDAPEYQRTFGANLTAPKTPLERATWTVKMAQTAIGIIDNRNADWAINCTDTVTDNGSSVFSALTKDRKPLNSLDLESAQMAIDDTTVSTGASVALANPLNADTWRVGTLAGLGEALKAGDIRLIAAL